MGQLREVLSIYGGLVASVGLGVAAILAPRKFARRKADANALRMWLWVLASIALLHVIFVLLARGDKLLYTVNDAWPLRIFSPRLGLLQWPDIAWLVAGVGLIAGCVLILVARPPATWLGIWAASCALIVVLNAAQGGIGEGLTASVSNPPHFDQTYDDARDLPPLSQFDEIATVRRWRSPHTKSHPPLPLLLLTLARSAEIGPTGVAWILVALASFAPPLAFLLYRSLLPRSHRVASRLALLLALSPTVNIYSGSSLEGPYLTLALAVCLVFVAGIRRRSRGLLALAGLIYLSLCLYSFGAAWLAFALPFLALAAEPGYLRRVRALLLDATAFATPVLAGYGLLRATFDYDYLGHVSNISKELMGVHWLASPLVAVASRLQNIAELILLGSPVLVASWWHAMSRFRRSPRAWIARWGSIALPLGALLLFTPVYSEFGRGWLILAPVLVLPAAPWLHRADSARLWLLGAGGCTWLLQAFGYHGW